MPYLSQLLHSSVDDSWNERVGKLVDVVAPPTPVAALVQHAPAPAANLAAGAAPIALALIVETPDEHLLRVLPAQVGRVEHDHIPLRVPRADLESDRPRPDDVRLAAEVLNKQVVDLTHKRVVRVNDILLDENWRLLGLDCTNLGLLRWLAPARLYEAVARRFPAPLLLWEQTGLLPARAQEAAVEVPAPQATESGPLAQLHPADIADILHDLSQEEGSRVLASLDTETAAETLEEIERDHQLRLLERMASSRAADILEEMGPDKAADLLAELPEERAQELLGLMKREESEDVQELLAYPEDSAGGMMTTDYVLVGQDRMAEEALLRVRAAITQDVRVAYVYCVADDTREDEEQRLLGVASLWELLAADPERPLREWMETSLISVQPDADPQTVAEMMAKYDLLALPVLDEQGCIQGIVTVDDALDVLLPPNRRRRARRMY
ncbi:MAG TPA: CBS domain-containing protein [Ktedonobacterales bacterium]|jgi:CBS domain-containing protein